LESEWKLSKKWAKSAESRWKLSKKWAKSAESDRKFLKQLETASRCLEIE